MRLLSRGAFAFALLLVAPSAAHAHLVNTGMGPFYDGAIHLALSPEDWLGLLAAALLAGLGGARAGRWTLAVLPAAWFVAAIVGLRWPIVTELPGLSILSFVVLGLLVALDVKLPAWGVATLGGLFGLLHGLLNGAALHEAGAGLLNVLGIVTTVFVLLLLISAAVVSLRPAWTRVGVRVAGSWVVTVGTLMFGWLFRGTVLVFVALLLLSSTRAALGCGGCFKLPYQSLLERVERADRVVVAHATDPTDASWKIDRVIKGRKADGNETIQTDQLSVRSRSNFHGPHILTWNRTFDTWTTETPAGHELVQFLSRAIGFSAVGRDLMPIRKQAGQLRFFLPYLEHSDRQIADSTHSKFASAPYAVLQELAEDLDVDQLRTWIDDQSAANNKRVPLSIVLLGICGGQPEADLVRKWIERGSNGGDSAYLAALFTANIELRGEDAVGFLENSYFQSRNRTLGEVLAAIDALRTHGQAGTTISRERVRVSFQLLLRERPMLAETIIDDFARWKDWSIVTQLMQIHAGGKQPWNNAMIIKYLKACPLPKVKQYVDRRSAADDARPQVEGEVRIAR